MSISSLSDWCAHLPVQAPNVTCKLPEARKEAPVAAHVVRSASDLETLQELA